MVAGPLSLNSTFANCGAAGLLRSTERNVPDWSMMCRSKFSKRNAHVREVGVGRRAVDQQVAQVGIGDRRAADELRVRRVGQRVDEQVDLHALDGDVGGDVEVVADDLDEVQCGGAREELAADQGAQQRGAGRVADVEDVDALGAPLVGVIAVDRHRGAGRGGAHPALERQRVGQGRLRIDLERVGHRAAARGQGRRAHREAGGHRQSDGQAPLSGRGRQRLGRGIGQRHGDGVEAVGQAGGGKRPEVDRGPPSSSR